MRRFFGLFKKELQVFFSQPVAYVVMAFYSGFSGFFFHSIAHQYAQYSMRAMGQYNRAQINLNLADFVFANFFYNIITVLLFMLPLLTMRLFSEEKREGTSELLFTYPVSDFTIVAAKFLSAYTVYAMLILSSVLSFVLLRFSTPFEIGPVITGLTGFLLVGAAFIMLGILISAMTESQIVAAIVSFGILLGLMILPWAAQSAGPELSRVLQNVSYIQHFESFAKGSFNTGDIAYFLCFFALAFFVTLRVLESKQWRG